MVKKHVKSVSEKVNDDKISGNMCIDDNTVVQKNKGNLEISKKGVEKNKNKMASGRNVSMNVEVGNNDFVSENMAVGVNDNQQVFYSDDHSGECQIWLIPVEWIVQIRE